MLYVRKFLKDNSNTEVDKIKNLVNSAQIIQKATLKEKH